MLKSLKIFVYVLVILSSVIIDEAYALRPPLMFNRDSLRGIDTDLRNDMYGKISSILVYHNNRVLLERQYGFSQVSSLHPISSVTKSITSLAVGICIDHGFITSIDKPIYRYFPDYPHLFTDSLKRKITLRHLLNQTSGLEWDEWSIHYSYAGNPLIVMSHTEESWVYRMLNLPITSAPGDTFTYNSGLSEVVKEIICRTSGMKFVPFVEQYLLDPLGIATYHWDSYPFNAEPAWGGLSLTTRDMAKIGQLVLNRGVWRDSTIVSAGWIEESTAPCVGTPKADFGLHWWIDQQPNGKPLIFAAGYGDQYVYIMPDRNLVVAINGRNFTDHKWERDHEELIQRIIRSID